MLSLTTILLYNSLFFLLSFIIFWVIIPYRRIHSYKNKDHITTEFFPFLGIMKTLLTDLKQKGDMLASLKFASKDYPNQKVLVTHANKSIVFVLRDPQYIKEFLQNPQHYQKERLISFLKPLLGTGLIFAEDETWKLHRKIISSSFHYEFLKGNTSLIQRITRELLNKIPPSEYENFDVLRKIQEITGEVVGLIFFGENLNNYTIEGERLTMELASIGADLCECGQNPLMLLFGPEALNFWFVPSFAKIMRRIKNFRKTCLDIVRERKSQPTQTNDLLESLLLTQSAEDPQARFSDEDIVNEFVTFFMAGMDTTAHLVLMSLYLLSKHPEHLKELKEERDNTYNKEEPITTEALQKMDVAHSVLKEALRLYTPVPSSLSRMARKDHSLFDLQVKKGDVVVPHFYTLFFNEKYFSDAFESGRWRTNEKQDPYAFTPFSAGPRNCIGQHLAIIEAKIVLSEFLEKFEFSMKEGYQLKMIARFSYEPVDPLLFDLKPFKK